MFKSPLLVCYIFTEFNDSDNIHCLITRQWTHTVDMDSELFCSKMEATRDCFLWMNDEHSVANYYGLSRLSK